ncbi:amidohydrolase [Lutimonas halocynthiae]|uniref:amidohydrolase n=1 Tax=Lutimonas halocynthiae TaxID=1446477 RepID=UPI0025B47A04|nr:amidohydrolase [Lutimonas halocynthiae]MDN3641416.1 amidohydrolase [Lutimonas halocynthiae]
MKKIQLTLSVLFISLLISCNTETKKETADMVFTNGNVITVDEARPAAEAVAVKDGKIVFVGSSEEAQAYIGEGTETTDLAGKTMMPGFVSAHDHLIASSWVSLGVQIYDAKDRAEALAMIKAYAEANPDKKVIQGIGWDTNMLGGYPVATELDAAVPNRPAFILDNTIHDAWLNTAALTAANITKDTPDTVPGVTFWMRDAEGNPTGIAIEIQWFEAYGEVAWDPENMIRESAEELYAAAASNGTTTFLCPGIVTPNIKDVHDKMEKDFVVAMDLLKEKEDNGTLKMRTVALPMYKSAIGDPQKFVDFGLRMNKKYNSDKLMVTSLKIHPEGNTVAGTAPHIENYLGTDGNGSFNVQPEETMSIVTQAAKVGLDVMIHTDGDRSSKAAVDAILAAREIDADNRSALHHAIFVHPDDQQRIIDNKIPVNSTPNFTNTFGNGDKDNIRIRGEEQVNSSLGRYPHLARNGVPVSISADVPSTPISMQGPLFVAQCATTLKDASNPNATAFPENRTPMTVEEAIRAITIDAAWQLSLEDKVGSIVEGKLADFVILEASPYEVGADKLKDIKVVATIMDGEYTHKADDRTAYNLVSDEHFAPMPAELIGCDHGSNSHRN